MATNETSQCREHALGSTAERYCAGLCDAGRRSPKTERAYRSDLCQFAAAVGFDASVRSLTRSQLEEWLNQLRCREYKPATMRRKIACVRAFLRYQRRHGVLAHDPLESVDVTVGREHRLTPTLLDHEFQSLLNATDRQVETCMALPGDAQLLAQRNQAIIWLLCGTGIRVGELVELRTRDVDQMEGVLRISGKGRKQRLAFTVDHDGKRLMCYFRIRSSFQFDHDHVFVNHQGRAITTEGVRAIVANTARAAGLDRRITPHMLRHTAATRLLQHGANLRVVQEFLGHSSIRMTERYTHVTAAALREAVKIYSPLSRVAPMR